MPATQHQSPKSDIEISQAAKKRPILDIAKEKLGISPDNLEPYGHYKAKVSMDYVKSLQSRPNGKLILVSAITPTPAGEGKTTTTVGLTDALNHIGKKAMLCLREPSLGPSFGMKGGAAGGGYAQVVPMEDINLHFTGDFHAITSANNLLAAMLDGKQLRIFDAKPLPARDPKGIGGKLGEIVAVEADGFTVVCADGRFKVTRVQPPDGKKIEAGEWAKSTSLAVKSRFS